MWSVGVLTYIMLSGKLPFTGKDDHETLGLISCGFDPEVGFKSKLWSEVSDLGKQFISQLLILDPTQRLTAEKALEHPWIQ